MTSISVVGLEDLGEHELLVAQYYYSIGAWIGARLRVQYLLANYPETKAASEAKNLLATLGDRGEVPAPPPPATPTPSFSPFEHR